MDDTPVLPITISTAVLHLHNHLLPEDVHHTVLTTAVVLTTVIVQGQETLQVEAVQWGGGGRIPHRTITGESPLIHVDVLRHHQGLGHRSRIEIVADREEEMGP